MSLRKTCILQEQEGRDKRRNRVRGGRRPRREERAEDFSGVGWLQARMTQDLLLPQIGGCCPHQRAGHCKGGTEANCSRWEETGL